MVEKVSNNFQEPAIELTKEGFLGQSFHWGPQLYSDTYAISLSDGKPRC